MLTSATDLLLGDDSGFVRPDALLVLVLVTDVDDYGAYDQAGGNTCIIGCNTAPPHTVDQMVTILSVAVKSGIPGAVAAIVIAGDPAGNGGLNGCGQPASCCSGGIDCDAFHADRLYAFADALGSNGYTADLCTANVPSAVETALTESIDLACMNFEPEG